ncbi:unnamed protein product [Caenorhabditis angaria]|uniref:LysM domain-containing protein n=1 Tax=Caenorhabditis angaria TaxID=860376 RepID=A0A9P1IQH3_9PELO|nr:unnamed protein product [Caenorhabditis angaria]
MILKILFVFLIIFPNTVSSICGENYVVKPGDSCWLISKDNQKSIEELKKLNPELNCESLWVGKKICLQPTCKKMYSTKEGDFCWKIYTENGLSETEFFLVNPGLKCETLQIGQRLCVGL